MRSPDEQASRGLRLVLAGIVTIPAAVGVTAAFPEGARRAVFIIGLGLVAGLCIAGGLAARKALLAGTTRVGRSVLGGIAGLTLGVVAAVSFVTALLGSVP